MGDMRMNAADSLQEFLAYHRRMVVIMAGVCLAVLAALLAVGGGNMALPGGFAAGAAARLIKFRFLDLAVVRQIAVEKKDAAAAQLKSMALWMTLFILAALAVFTFNLNVWAMVAGIFLPPLILVADTYARPNLFARPDTGGNDGGATAEDAGE